MLDWTLEDFQKVDRVVLSPIHQMDPRFLDHERHSFFSVRMFVGDESLASATYPDVNAQELVSASSCWYLQELMQAITKHKFSMVNQWEKGQELLRTEESVVAPEPDGRIIPLTLENLRRVEEIRIHPDDLFGLFINTCDRIHRNLYPEGRVSFYAEHLLCDFNPLGDYFLRLIGAIHGSRFEIPPEIDSYSSIRRSKR